jgi:thiosulfate dehydrogenase (quinone) large subunit
MMFVFGYLGEKSGTSGWPIHLMYLTETVLIAVAVICGLLAIVMRGTAEQWKRSLVAIAGGLSASFGLIMPFELAPFFFNVSGEIMLGTIALNFFYLPAAFLLHLLLLRFMKPKMN